MMPAPNTGGQLRTKIEDMEIGDYIPYTYEIYCPKRLRDRLRTR